MLLGRREGDVQYVVGGGARRREHTRTHVRPVQRALQTERAGREHKPTQATRTLEPVRNQKTTTAAVRLRLRLFVRRVRTRVKS